MVHVPKSPIIQNAPASLFDKIKNVFNDEDDNTSSQTIKVVNEESQVISVVEKTSPAVVSIVASTEVTSLQNCYGGDFYSNLPQEFRKFFNVPDNSNCQQVTQKVKVGAGTGFLVSADGYIVTNKHVVDNTKAEYTVILNDKNHQGEKKTAKVLARDPSNDIAVLKIDVSNMPYITFGDSDKLKVGQTAIAIGYALGEFDNTVSKGVISGLARSISASGNGKVEDLKGLIQTDAAINPGNSGGPLLNIDGQAIGINVATANAQSIGFAIPIKLVKKAYEETKQNGSIAKEKVPFLGVRYLPIDSTVKVNNSLPYDYGVLVVRGQSATDLAVVPGSSANKAGIVENDIILEIDNTKIDDTHTLSSLISKHKVGDEISLKVYSQGKEKTVKVKLEEKNNN